MSRWAVAIVIATVCAAAVASAGQRRPTEGDARPKGASSDATYGYSESNPIMVGQKNGGPVASRRFLDALRGPDGQKVTYKRTGSCCPFKTPNAWIGDTVLLDGYEITYEGLTKPVLLYIDFYDYEQPMVPVGFTSARR